MTCFDFLAARSLDLSSLELKLVSGASAWGSRSLSFTTMIRLKNQWQISDLRIYSAVMFPKTNCEKLTMLV
jgi:hypothetical protein